jgi:hypothetical protein
MEKVSRDRGIIVCKMLDKMSETILRMRRQIPLGLLDPKTRGAMLVDMEGLIDTIDEIHRHFKEVRKAQELLLATTEPVEQGLFDRPKGEEKGGMQ